MVQGSPPFDIKELRELTAYDELELDTLGDKKTALFITISDTDATFNFLVSMCYTQLFNLLCDKADDEYGGRLPCFKAQSQLKALYKDYSDTIIGNCDSMIFLGGKEKTTLKDLTETLGKETIDMFNTSDTRGSQRSYGINYQRLGKELLHLMVKSSVAQNKMSRDTIQLDFLQKACKVA